MMKTFLAFATVGTLVHTPALVADILCKALVLHLPPVRSWTGLYAGVGGRYGSNEDTGNFGVHQLERDRFSARCQLGPSGGRPVACSAKRRATTSRAV
jgi:hypothetical protein